jgi:serine protease Do
MTLSPVTKDLIDQLGLPADTTGLLIKAIDPTSQAADKGLAPGDVITEAGQQKLTSVADLTGRIDEARSAGRKSILLLVRRNGDPRFVALGIEK